MMIINLPYVGVYFLVCSMWPTEANEWQENCINPFCPNVTDDEFMSIITYNSKFEATVQFWILFTLEIIIFIGGIAGNILVCVAVCRNRSMRTVTNYYLVSLALADFLVIFLRVLLMIVTLTYSEFLSMKRCYIIPYLHMVTIDASIFTLAMISIDRWFAICKPLTLKSTPKRARNVIILIWIFSFLFAIPDLLWRIKGPGFDVVEGFVFIACDNFWATSTSKTLPIFKLTFLYFGPFALMMMAYGEIYRALWKREIAGNESNENLDIQLLISRRKAVKMIIVVVLVFAICYTPIHIFNIVINLTDIKDPSLYDGFYLSIYLIVINSAINPLIYTFMSEKFRTEFRRSICCLSRTPLNNHELAVINLPRE